MLKPERSFKKALGLFSNWSTGESPLLNHKPWLKFIGFLEEKASFRRATIFQVKNESVCMCVCGCAWVCVRAITKS